MMSKKKKKKLAFIGSFFFYIWEEKFLFFAFDILEASATCAPCAVHIFTSWDMRYTCFVLAVLVEMLTCVRARAL